MISFVIPSIGRSTLKNTLESLINQTNPNWECWVGFDGLDESQVDKHLLIDDSRINYLYLKDRLGIFTYNSGVNGNTGSAGKVRNYLIEQIDNDYEWIGFVDDDDTLRPYYIEKLLEEKNNNTTFDCCIFRMINGSIIIPPLNTNQVIQNLVGISFCVKKNFIKERGIKFENSTCEDYKILESIHNSGGEIYMSEHITYNVRGNSNDN
jgi:glycosyltransferase involved in cell wall biosynthesis